MPICIRFIENLAGSRGLSKTRGSPPLRATPEPTLVYLGEADLSTQTPSRQRLPGGYVPLRRITILTVLKRIERSNKSDWFLM